MTPVALRQKFVQDLELAGLADGTCRVYVWAVGQLAKHYHQSPDTLSETQVRDYLFHLRHERDFAIGSLKIAYSALRFFWRMLERKAPGAEESLISARMGARWTVPRESWLRTFVTCQNGAERRLRKAAYITCAATRLEDLSPLIGRDLRVLAELGLVF